MTCRAVSAALQVRHGFRARMATRGRLDLIGNFLGEDDVPGELRNVVARTAPTCALDVDPLAVLRAEHEAALTTLCTVAPRQSVLVGFRKLIYFPLQVGMNGPGLA